MAGWVLMAHACNPSTWEGGRGRKIMSFEASLSYTERPCLKKKRKKTQDTMMPFLTVFLQYEARKTS
jgi:hypothetical protein